MTMMIMMIMMMIIRVLDDDGSGTLGYKEFLQAIDLVGARTPDDKLRLALSLENRERIQMTVKLPIFRWAFKMYDEDNSREIDINEMERVMQVSD